MGDLVGYEALTARITAVSNADGRVGDRMLRTWQLGTIRRAKLAVPRKTGNLGRTIHAGAIDGRRGATVLVSAEYASAVELGTRAHEIRPRPGRIGRNGRPAALAWGGARRLTGTLRSGASPEHFARSVQHPGTRPRPFLRPAAIEALEFLKLEDEYVVAWNAAA